MRLDPPGPTRLSRFSCTLRMRYDPMRFLTRVAVKYGGITRIPLKRGFLYLVSGPDLVKALLIDHRTRFSKNVRYSVMQRLLGQGLLLTEGDVWRRQRVASQPSFKPGALEQQIGSMTGLIARHLDGWDERCAGDARIEILQDLTRLAQQLAGQLIFGSVYTAHAPAVFELTETMQRCWPTQSRLPQPRRRKRMASKAEQLAAALTGLDAEFFAMVDESQASDEPCVMTTLRRDSPKRENGFSRMELRDQAKTLFFAGYETTATSLSWAQYLLAKNPAVQRRLVEEVDRVAPRRCLTVADVDAMPYLEQVFKESLRLYSPIHSLSRVALEDCELGGYHIPKGATAMVSLYALHRLPQYWPDPERFDPERFSVEGSANQHRFAYLPFAAGHRNCIGASLAMIEAKLMLAQIARRFDLELISRGKVRAHAGTTMRPAVPIHMKISRRH